MRSPGTPTSPRRPRAARWTRRWAPSVGSLKKGDIVTLVGFGSFYVGKRTARQGRNPRTNEPIKIRAAKVPKFRAGKALKDALN